MVGLQQSIMKDIRGLFECVGIAFGNKPHAAVMLGDEVIEGVVISREELLDEYVIRRGDNSISKLG